METILQDYFNGICCNTIVPPTDGLNRYSFEEGFAPTIEDMETKLGFALLNPRLEENTWHFDNEGYTVPDSAFVSSNMVGVVFADSVTSIGKYSFASNEITSLVIPDSVTLIDTKAFQANQITSLIIPDSVITLGNSSFSNNLIETLTLGTGLTTIDISAFGSNELTILNVNCTTLGFTTGDDQIFVNNTGKDLTINALVIHQDSNDGNMEGDLDYLNNNNNTTINWI
jgi:hypothetical protein